MGGAPPTLQTCLISLVALGLFLGFCRAALLGPNFQWWQHDDPDRMSDGWLRTQFHERRDR